MLTHPQDNGTRAIAAPTAAPAPALHSLGDIVSAVRDLALAGFTITPSATPDEYVASLEHNSFRVRVTLNCNVAEQNVGVSRIANGTQQCLLLRNGRFRRGEWLPFTMDDAVNEALIRLRQIGGKR